MKGSGETIKPKVEHGLSRISFLHCQMKIGLQFLRK